MVMVKGGTMVQLLTVVLEEILCLQLYMMMILIYLSIN